jgi:hypothetical protein
MRINGKFFWACMALIIAMFLYVYTLVGQKGVVELTKTEALQLQNIQFQAVSIQADLNEMVLMLAAKYGVSMETHNLDLAGGRFVPLPTELAEDPDKSIEEPNEE